MTPAAIHLIDLPRAWDSNQLSKRCRDYQRMETTLAWLCEHFEDQPSLKNIASHAGMSEYHFQRLFTRWAGISPKKFVQYLTLQSAKRSLALEHSVLDASFDAGLSGAGRLHDLFVYIDAITPGEYKASGEGLTIRYGFHPSPFGECLLMASERGICGLAFRLQEDRATLLEAHSRGFERARLVPDQANTLALHQRIFAKPEQVNGVAPLTLLTRGSPFQVKVWEALLEIPTGALVTYQDVANSIGKPKAVRAVASAVASNAIAYLIPCHRVIRKSGALGGYRWGAARKLGLLSQEQQWRAAANLHSAA